MRNYQNFKIIGVDAGYGNMKTARTIFPTGLKAMDTEPMFEGDIMKYGDTWYRIGEGHKSFIADKTEDEEFYILTLAAIACELSVDHITTASVLLAVGLPTMWTNRQKDEYREYMLKDLDVEFTFRKTTYHIHIVDCMVFPQGYSAAVRAIDNDRRDNHSKDFGGTVMMADIGNGTMNVMRFQGGRPSEEFSWTEKLGVNQCVLAMKKRMMDSYGLEIPDVDIDQFLRTKTISLSTEYASALTAIAEKYVSTLFDSLRSHDYDSRIMKLYVVGGGGCLIRNFGHYNQETDIFEDDLKASAKGFEYMAQAVLWKRERGERM